MERKLLILVLLTCSQVFSLEKRDVPCSLKTSILIPCHPNHFRHLEHLLEEYAGQTRLPDEVIISLSEVSKISTKDLQALEHRDWPFAFIILKSPGTVSAGGNRTRAARRASGDLFICQDADDIPHPQRVEAIAYLFEHFKIHFLLHQYHHSDQGGHFVPYAIEDLSSRCRHAEEYADTPGFANGPTALLKEVFEKIQWNSHFSTGEDNFFKKDVCKHLGGMFLLEASLLDYRIWLSSHRIDESGNWHSK